MLSLKNEMDFKDISVVHLMLGSQCNMCCRHCSQNPVKKDNFKDEFISSDVCLFIDNFINFAVNGGNRKKYLFYFWGGEALLHWDLIKSIVIKYSKKYHLNGNNKFQFVISSNGLLLTEDIVQFINYYGIQFNFSYDAPEPFIVRGFVSDDICNLVNEIRNLVVISSFNAVNCDFYSAYYCLRTKFPNARISLMLELMYTFGMPKDIVSFDYSVLRENFRKVRIAVQYKENFFVKFVSKSLSPILSPDVNSFFLKNGVKSCFAGMWYLPVTLYGDVMFCHNSGVKIGTLNDSLQEIYDKGFAYVNQYKSLQCLNCKHKDICIGPCTVSLWNKDKFVYCDLYKKQVYDVFKEEMKLIGKPLSEKDMVWFENVKSNLSVVINNFLEKGGKKYGMG